MVEALHIDTDRCRTDNTSRRFMTMAHIEEYFLVPYE